MVLSCKNAINNMKDRAALYFSITNFGNGNRQGNMSERSIYVFL